MNPDSFRLLGSAVVSFLLSYMLMKAWLPFAPKRPGEVLLQAPLGFLQRVLVHRTQAMLLMAYVVIGSSPFLGSRIFIEGTEFIAVGGLVLILMLPLRYVFTDRGVAINNGVPRLYRQFRRFDVRPGKRWLASNVTVVLRGRKTDRGTHPSYPLFLPVTARDEVVRLLKRHVR
ncbi:MAG: hypothetical protein AVDCRST_MAG77-4206 [uncultured Chloroflexi bacterium]|uniref:DUF5673 domain-containing protein n=1 Tax=uncultured Chloroflexota bacterium TaxID=166587 RepID=A0A6J4JS12_9CHLR|nr:MAG: hypothetical protein AVDCRST_MAG77-4206 [uncultured Chloroflexota bacterium]